MTKDGYEFDRTLEHETNQYTDQFHADSESETEEKELEEKFNSLRRSGLAYLKWLSIVTIFGNIIAFSLIYYFSH